MSAIAPPKPPLANQSPFISMFLEIQRVLMKGLPEHTYIDQDLGQLRNSTRPPVTWPCVLIDFEDFSFENLSENVQTATGTIVFQLGFAPYSNSSQATSEKYVQQAMGYYALEFTLNQLVQGWSPMQLSGSLIRTSVKTQKRSDQYRVRELRYSIEFEDYSARTDQQTAPYTLVLTDEIDIPDVS